MAGISVYLLLFTLSGFSGLIYESIWTQYLFFMTFPFFFG